MSRKRILVVDDEKDVCDLLEEMLDYLGYEVMGAKDGREALNMLSASGGKWFDLVIADLNMPEVDGRSLLKSIRRENRKLPVVIITGYGTAATPDEMAALGADGYLAKPFMIQEVQKLVADLLEEREVSWFLI